MRRRQQFAVAHSLLEAQAAALKNWARRQKIAGVPSAAVPLGTPGTAESVPAKEVVPAESQPETTPPGVPRGMPPVTHPGAAQSEQPEPHRPGFCMRCGRHIGQGVWMHQKTCKG